MDYLDGFKGKKTIDGGAGDDIITDGKDQIADFNADDMNTNAAVR